MNGTIYIFGQLGGKYTQYPTDYTQTYFQEFERTIKAKTAIGIRRIGDLMQYQYIRRLSDSNSARDEYIGIAVVYNGVIVNDLKPLFQTFEDTITNLVVCGKILQFTDSGDIVSTIGNLYQASSEFARVSEYLSAQLSAQSALFEKLPAKNYAISEKETKSFSIQDDTADIIEATRNYSKVYVLKDADYNSAALTSYSAKLRALNTEKETAQKTIKKQKSEITSVVSGKRLTKLQRKQKNFKLVLLLIVVIFIGIIGVFSYRENTNAHIRGLNMHIEDLETSNATLQQDIEQKKDTINDLLAEIQQQVQKIYELTAHSEQLDANLEEANRQLSVTKAKVEQLTSENQAQTRTIATLQNRLNSNTSSASSPATSSYSSYSSNIVGAKISSSTTTAYDKNYALWIYAKKPVKINSFFVKSNKSGYITIGLYNANHTLIDSKKVYLSNGAVTKVTTEFSIATSGRYYLAIEKSNDIGLSYHKSNASEYSKYKSGDLQIIGTSQKGQNDIRETYYQYFYSISYSSL